MYMDADKRLAEYKKLNQYMESIDEEAVASSSTSVNSQNATSFFKENKQISFIFLIMTLLPKIDYLKIKASRTFQRFHQIRE